jgi:Fanconi anemia group M protein
MSYVEHPLIKPNSIEARQYQQLIFNTAIQGNSLVVLPTGLGKTSLAMMVAAYRLTKFPDGKILIMAPTRPLAVQHCQTFARSMALPPEDFKVLTGQVPPAEREKVWREAKLIFATPQTVEHDIISGKLALDRLSLVIVDEAHRAVGNYPYGFIAGQYMRAAKDPLILGLTASPGAEPSRIEEVRRNLFIEKVEMRSERDADVRPYVQPIEIEWRRLELPAAFVDIKNLLEGQMKELLLILKKHAFLPGIQGVGKRDLLRVQGQIKDSMREFEPKPPEHFYTCLVAQAAAFRLCHAIELLETQGLTSLEHYLSRLMRKARMPGCPRAVKILADAVRVQQAYHISKRLHGRADHPKISESIKIIQKQFNDRPNSRVMVFAHYRDSVDKLFEALSKLDGIRAMKFIGQAEREGEKGLTQREQAQILGKFRKGEVNVLISTAVGEEGLDIPNVDLVLFYEAVPSEIRLIQRRGRTGRTRPGRVIVLLAKGTRDEAFYWSAVHKEERMREALREYGEGESMVKEQRMIEEFTPGRVKIIVDHREVPSGVVHELAQLGVEVEARQLDVGDFILSDRVGVERKSVGDFLQSIVDKRLLSQAKQLSETFERPVLILEGEGLYSRRAIHPNAIRGALAALAVDFGISILPTQDEKETAAVLAIIARREQTEQAREVAVRGEAKGLTLPEQQRFVVEGLPGVSAVLAERLLAHFGTVEKVMAASEEELQKVRGIGKEKAKEIRRVLSTLFQP